MARRPRGYVGKKAYRKALQEAGGSPVAEKRGDGGGTVVFEPDDAEPRRVPRRRPARKKFESSRVSSAPQQRKPVVLETTRGTLESRLKPPTPVSTDAAPANPAVAASLRYEDLYSVRDTNFRIGPKPQGCALQDFRGSETLTLQGRVDKSYHLLAVQGPLGRAAKLNGLSLPKGTNVYALLNCGSQPEVTLDALLEPFERRALRVHAFTSQEVMEYFRQLLEERGVVPKRVIGFSPVVERLEILLYNYSDSLPKVTVRRKDSARPYIFSCSSLGGDSDIFSVWPPVEPSSDEAGGAEPESFTL